MAEHQHSDKHEAHRRLIARLEQQAGEVRHITSGLDDASLARRTAAGKWSLIELVCHLERVQQVFEGRIEAMLAQDNPPIVRYDPEGDKEFEKMTVRPPRESLGSFVEARRRLLARLEQLSPAEWHRPGKHSDFPHYDVHFQVEYMAHHEAHHVYQMFERRQPLGKMAH